MQDGLILLYKIHQQKHQIQPFFPQIALANQGSYFRYLGEGSLIFCGSMLFFFLLVQFIFSESSLFFFPAIQGMFPEIVGFPPKSSNLIGVFHYFHHPFWGTSIFGNTHIITNFHGWKMSKKSIFSAVIFAKRPAGLLAGKI